MKKTNADGDNESSKSLIVEYPVVVIDDFLAKGKYFCLKLENIRGHHIYDILVEWAAQIAEARIAHVIFSSDNPAAFRSIGKGIIF
jgi:hypothetical protein